MYKQSPSRGLKSKGNKVKRVVQVLVLVTICFWLMYQVRHSEEKRGAFDAKDEKVVNDALMEDEILRFSRKDLPRFTEKIGTGGEKDGGDDGEKDPDEEDEEENKLEKEKNQEDDEPEREDRRIEETDEDRGGGDDEMDENEHENEHEHEHENEQENENEEVDEDKGKEDNEEDEHEVVKIEAEHEHEDEEVDEDKGKEDKDEDVEEENRAENVEKEFHENDERNQRIDADEDDDERKEDRSDLEEVQEVNEGGDQENVDAHETREEQYKADDASSEVAHHVRSIIPKTENVTLDHATDIFGEVETGQESESKSSDIYDEMSSNLTSVDEEHPRVHSATNANSSQNINVENSSTHTSDDEDAGAFQHDPIDTFDVSVAEEEEESRDDMDTLPDIKMEGQAAEEAMAE